MHPTIFADYLNETSYPHDVIEWVDFRHPTIRHWLGIPTDADLEQWVRENQDAAKAADSKWQTVLPRLAEQVYKTPAGKWAPRYTEFSFDPHDAYMEVSDHQQTTCTSCDVIFLTDWGYHCPYCGKDCEENTQSVDMYSGFAEMEVADRVEAMREDYVESLEYFVNSLAGDVTHLILESGSLGWNNAPGYAECIADWQKLDDLLSLNCDFSIHIKHDHKEQTLTVSRSHHDRPTGETITVYPARECEFSQELIKLGDPAWTAQANEFFTDGLETDCVGWEGLLEVTWDHLGKEAHDLVQSIGPDITVEQIHHLITLVDTLKAED